ncbi:serine/threonine-protein kinase [Cellulomonas sp. KRMCY2]|uniref:serine/threonine-protein kinase n=1 Tax=Cellulomonas sp. KRMCY2 TaxID=1304865 RepID=UPI00045E9BCD|nr:serine/threonine-protein kinase [Cellulomonas sp. KRMCY2]
MERIGVVPGTEIGGYRILGPLGQGGMGAVYRAVDGEGVVVALKLLHPHLGADPDARERLSREVANLQRVRHPAVARVLDAEIDSAEAFVVTELVDGEDLAAWVRSHGSMGSVELADLAEKLRAALELVHDAGVLHRDLTPGNVLVTDRGPVLIDFGIAQAAEDARVTSTGLVVGTPGYLSPELLEGGEPSEAGDWWGWAALLAFAATGRPPFGTRPLQTVLTRVQTGEADLSGLDRRTTAALRSALAVDPWRRPSPEQVVAELRLAAAGEPDLEPDLAADEPVTQLLADGEGTQVTGPPGAPGAGGTRVMPLAAAAPVDAAAGAPDAVGGSGEGPYQEDEAYEDEGYEDDDLADDEDDEDDEGESQDVPPEPRRRVGTVLALGAAVVAAGALRPGIALLAAVALAVLVRSVGLAVSGVQARRARRGPGRGDVARAVVGWPWYLLRAVVGCLPSALVGASVVVVAGGVGWWLIDSGRVLVAEPAVGERAGELAGNAAWVTPALLAVAVLAGVLSLWFGPMSRSTRVGTRWTLAAVAPGRAGAAALILVALAAAGVLLTFVVLGHGTVWWPLPGPPDLR